MPLSHEVENLRGDSPPHRWVHLLLQQWSNPNQVKTTGSTGGLHSPYKGLIQASSLKGTLNLYFCITRTATRKRVRLCFYNFCNNPRCAFHQVGFHEARPDDCSSALFYHSPGRTSGLFKTHNKTDSVWKTKSVCRIKSNIAYHRCVFVPPV